MVYTLIGVDCASDPKNVGIALGTFADGETTIDRVEVCSRSSRPAARIAEWIRTGERQVLLALDAPLGWPSPLGEMLATHQAGDPPTDDAHRLFRRETDRFVRNRLKKQPLDVGADRIARTAHAALSLLDDIRHRVGQDIPLAWQVGFAGIRAIEVYPAAILTAHRLSLKGYKRSDGVAARVQLIDQLQDRIAIGVDRSLIEANADALDAVICVLAGHDFMSGRALPPEDLDLARREGWIWFCE